MELFDIRRHFKETYTIGRFYHENTLICNTLEDKVRELKDLNNDGDFDDPGEGKIYGKTAIPEGRYKVIVSHSPTLKRRLPELIDVPGFTGIRIHSGVNEHSTLGCILVGQNRERGKLTNGPYYEDYIRDLIEVAQARFEPVYITIQNMR